MEWPRMHAKLIATAILAFQTAPGFCDTRITAVPSNWVIQDYISSGDLIAFFAGSTCLFQQVQLPGSLVSSEERNRFLSVMTSAKALGRTVIVDYETTSGNCRVTTYGIQ